MVKDYSFKHCSTNAKVQEKIKRINNWVNKHGKIWSRKVLYELTPDLVKDTSETQYQQNCKLFENLREFSIIPYEWFKDKRTTIDNVGITESMNFDETFNYICRTYYRSPKVDQRYYVEVWTEKELAEDTIRILEKYDVGLVMGEGFIGDIPFHNAINRLKQILENYSIPIRIFYISDYDTEGEHTYHICKQTLEPLGDVTVKKLFLNKSQLEGLTSNLGYREKMLKPNTLKYHLSKGYVQEFIEINKDLQPDGIVQYELDQYDTDKMNSSLENTISSYVDRNLIINRIKECRNEVEKWKSIHYKNEV